MADAAMPVFDPRLFSGPTLIGSLMVYFLFGVFVLQTMTYLGGSPTGSVPWRYPHYLVALAFCLESLSVIFVTIAAWDQLVLNGTLPVNEWIPPVTAPATGVLNGMIAYVVQIFFAAKVWRLSTSTLERGVAIFISVLAHIGLGASAAVSIIFALNGRRYSDPMNYAIIVWLTSCVVCDIMITISMIHLLRRFRKRTAFSATKQLLRTLTRNTVENGLITSACALVNIVVYFARLQHKDNIHIIFQYTVGRLYAVVLLTSLIRAQHSNSQQNTTRETNTVSGGNVPANAGGIPLSTQRMGVSGTWRGTASHLPSSGRVQIQVQRTIQDDLSDSDDYKASAIAWDRDTERRSEVQSDREKNAYSREPGMAV